MKELKHLGAYGIIIKDDQILLIKKVSGPYDRKPDLPGNVLSSMRNKASYIFHHHRACPGLLHPECTLIHYRQVPVC